MTESSPKPEKLDKCGHCEQSKSHNLMHNDHLCISCFHDGHSGSVDDCEACNEFAGEKP